ncbi:MAG: hypothetical protein QM482_09660 [Sulfurospirillum sp.]
MNRSGFGLMQALLVIVLISGILVIAMKYATVNVKQTRDIYLKESAELFMNSAVELGLLAISGYDRNSTNPCLNEVSITSPNQRFIADVNITKYYLLAGSADCIRCGSLCEPIDTKESQGMVMLEVTVETNTTHPKNHGKQIILKRRTLQRP